LGATGSSSTPSPTRAWGTPQQAEQLAALRAAAQAALAVGLGLNAGHDLNRDNLTDFLRACPVCRRCRSATR
jgi:pyridoxine 5-phosphate synthase